MESRKLDFIQMLRGLSAMGVVLVHFSGFVGPIGLHTMTKRTFEIGLAGVDMFFIISGFIMVGSTLNIHGSIRESYEFIAKRLARVWPTYAAMTAVVIVWFAGIGYLSDAPVRDRVIRSLLFIAQSTTEPPNMGDPFLFVGWTLNYEMYFYLVFALSMLAGRYRWTALFSWFALTLVVIPTIFAKFTFDAASLHGFSSAQLELVTNPIIFDFIIGSCVGLFYFSPISDRRAPIGLIIALWSAAAITGLFAYYGNSSFGLHRWTVPCAFIFIALCLRNRAQTIFPFMPLVFLGDISYSLYLVHPNIQAAAQAMARAHGKEIVGAGVAPMLLTISVCIVAAWLSREILEKRLSNVLRGLLLYRPRFHGIKGYDT